MGYKEVKFSNRSISLIIQKLKIHRKKSLLNMIFMKSLLLKVVDWIVSFFGNRVTKTDYHDA